MDIQISEKQEALLDKISSAIHGEFSGGVTAHDLFLILAAISTSMYATIMMMPLAKNARKELIKKTFKKMLRVCDDDPLEKIRRH